MKLCRLLSFLLIMLIVIPILEIILPKSSVVGSDDATVISSQSGLIKVALTRNVVPRGDWSNGTLYHLRILQKFIPINITVITNFVSLSEYQVLFLNMLNLSNSDATTIVDWVNDGGFLVCIGQSGRYDENGEERNLHPLATTLGIALDGWERTSGAEVRQIALNNTWHWWTSGLVYDVTNNGDGNYHELVDDYYVPKSECVNVTLNGAKQILSCRDKNRTSYFPTNLTFTTYEEPFLTTNTYGSGRSFFIAADVFYRLVWKPASGGIGLHNLYSNSMTAGFWFRSGLLWQILYGVMLDCFSNIQLPIVTSMPNGSYTAMSFGIKTTDGAYGNLTEYWQPQMLDKQPTLKGWFWGFWLLADIIDGTSDTDKIVNLVNKYGYAGSRGEGNLTLAAFAESSEILRDHGFMYKYEGSAGGPVGIWDVTTLVRNWNFTDIFYHRRISGRAEHGAYISSIPYPISNSNGLVYFFVSPYSVSQTYEWKWLIDHQKTLGQNYGIGGYCMGTNYVFWTGNIPRFNETINIFIKDDTVWKTSGQLFVDWWDKRWRVNMTDFSENSTQITIDLQTPEIENLTLLIKRMANPYRYITLDGAPVTPLPKSNRIVIPKLSEGEHRIAIRFAEIFDTLELKEYNDRLMNERKPYIVDSTHVIEYLNYTNQRLSVTLDLPTNTTAELKVYSTYSPRKIFADNQPVSFIYSANISTMSIPYTQADIYYAQPEITEFSSSKPVYETGEGVELTLKIHGDYATPEIIKWLVTVTVLNGVQEIVNFTNREIRISKGVTSTLIFPMGTFSIDKYYITAKISDPETRTALTINRLTIRVAQEMFSVPELKEYNDRLMDEGKPYIINSTHVIEYLNYTNQRLSVTLDLPTNITAELQVHSTYSPRKIFANNQPTQSLAYTSSIATLLVDGAHVDIYYAQPKISRFSSAKLEYRADEDISLTLEVYGDHSTFEPLKWLARITVLHGTQEIVNVTKMVEISTAEATICNFRVEELPDGIHVVIAEMLDPEAGNILTTDSLTMTIIEAPMRYRIFDSVELEEYNDDLRSLGLPYVQSSSQTIEQLAFSQAYQCLSITLRLESGIYTELKVYSTYSPRKIFADGQPAYLIHSANITTVATMLTPHTHVEIYYSQPEIIGLNSSKPDYKPDEDVELVLEIHGINLTADIVKWLIRFTVEDETERIIKIIYEEIELGATRSLAFQLIVGNLSVGTYAITAEMIDREAENILEARSLSVKVTEAAPTPSPIPLIPVFLTTIIAIVGATIYTWHRLKKPRNNELSVQTLI